MEEEKEVKIEEMSLREQVALIAKAARIDEYAKKSKKKQKKFKFLPKLGKGKLKKNFAIIILMRTNGYLDLMRLPIEDGFVYIKKVDMRYSVTVDNVLRWNNLPVLIIQEWSLEPICPTMLQRKTMDEKMSAWPQKILIDALKKGQISPKKMGGNIILWIIGGVVVLFLIASILGVKII
jgi:hypothetical protein